MNDCTRFVPFLVPLTVLVLTGCYATSQTTSGKEYLSRYSEPLPQTESTVSYHSLADGELVEETVQRVSTDELVRRAAEIEPLLQLPARIGLARIEGGRLATLPESELAEWAPLVETFGAKGSFVPVDPFLTDYTVRAVLPQDERALSGDAHHVLTAIRLGAARQHLDAVLVYEVGVIDSEEARQYGFRSLTVLDGGFLSDRSIEIEGRARALLIDVRNGYPYGTAAITLDLSETLPSWASDHREQVVKQRAIQAITAKLVSKIDLVMADLVRHMETRVAAKN